MASSALFALTPGVPAVLLQSVAENKPRTVTVVRPDGVDAFVCRLPKGGGQLRAKYTLLSVPSKNLRPIGTVENLLDGSMFPSVERPKELVIAADFVTCTQ